MDEKLFCITQPLSKYSVNVSGHVVGLTETYKTRPALLQLIMLFTSTPYMWEDGSVTSVLERTCSINSEVEGLLTDSLYCTFYRSGPMLVKALSDMSPYQFYICMEGWSLMGTMPICKKYEREAILNTMGARVGAWLGSDYGAGQALQINKDELKMFLDMDNKVKGILRNGK